MSKTLSDNEDLDKVVYFELSRIYDIYPEDSDIQA